MRHLLLKQGEIHQKLWDVDDTLQTEVILTAEQRVVSLLLEGHPEHFISKAVGVRRLQTLPVNQEIIILKDIVKQPFLIFGEPQ